MSQTYPNPCNNCGFCCVAIQCLYSIDYYGKLPKGQVCPALSFAGDVSSCGLIPVVGAEAIGVGKGCCVKARLVRDGKEFDFASLPDVHKIAAMRQIRFGGGEVRDGKTGEPIL